MTALCCCSFPLLRGGPFSILLCMLFWIGGAGTVNLRDNIMWRRGRLNNGFGGLILHSSIRRLHSVGYSPLSPANE